MKRTLAAATIAGLAVLAAAVSVPAVSAHAVSGPAHAVSGSAASRAPIRTYTQEAVASFYGIGSQRGSSGRLTESEQVILSPRLALKDLWTFSFALPIVHQKTSGQLYVVGNRSYAKSGSGSWVTKTLSAPTLAKFRRAMDLYSVLQQFKALPGVRRLGATHYSLTAPASRLASFTSQEFGQAAKELARDGFKTLILNLWTDRSGRPVKITLNSRSPIEICSLTETFSNFNKPLRITAP